MEKIKIMMWMLTWLNVSATELNATLQVLVIYRLESPTNIIQALNMINCRDNLSLHIGVKCQKISLTLNEVKHKQ